MIEVPPNSMTAIFVHKVLLEIFPDVTKYFKPGYSIQLTEMDVACLIPKTALEVSNLINAFVELKLPFTIRQRYYDSTTVTESPFHVNDGHWTMQPFRFLPNGQTNELDPYIDDPYRFTEEDIQMTKTAIMRETINPVLGKL